MFGFISALDFLIPPMRDQTASLDSSQANSTSTFFLFPQFDQQFCMYIFNIACTVKNSNTSWLGIHIIFHSKDLTLDGMDSLERKLRRVCIITVANVPKLWFDSLYLYASSTLLLLNHWRKEFMRGCGSTWLMLFIYLFIAVCYVSGIHWLPKENLTL